MRFRFVIATILAMASDDVIAHRPSHSNQWKCTHLVKKVYNDAVLNAISTPGIDCFEEPLALPDRVKTMTPVETNPCYMVYGPYIGESTTFRIVLVLEDKLENINMGETVEGEFATDCFKCKCTYYGDNVGGATCKELTMEECPERLSKEIYWNPPGNITSSSDAQYCVYKKENDLHKYLCIFLDAELDVMP